MLSQAAVVDLNGIFIDEIHPESPSCQPRKWQCILSETVIGDYCVVPLKSARKLKSEGYLMNNCCREYVTQCLEGEYQLFSIRTLSGERVATLGILNHDNHWQFDQCYGVSNSNVLERCIETVDEDGSLLVEYSLTEIYYVAHEVVRLMNAATIKNRQEDLKKSLIS